MAERDKNICVVDIIPLEAIFRGASGSIEGAAGFLADLRGLQAQGAAGSWRAVVNTVKWSCVRRSSISGHWTSVLRNEFVECPTTSKRNVCGFGLRNLKIGSNVRDDEGGTRESFRAPFFTTE